MTARFSFRNASEHDLETLIMWMDVNSDIIGEKVYLEIREWIDGDPDWENMRDLHDFLAHLEWHIESGE